MSADAAIRAQKKSEQTIGFTQKDLQKYITEGSTQSVNKMVVGTTEGGEPVSPLKVKRKEQMAWTGWTPEKGSEYSDVGDPAIEKTEDGIASITGEQVDLLTKAFLRRQKEIQNRLSTPGRSSLFFRR